MRGSVALVALVPLALLLSGCASSGGGGEADAAQQDALTMEEAQAIWSYGNFTASSDSLQTGALPYLLGGPVPTGAVLHDLGPRPEGFVQLDLRLEWTCLTCPIGQELVLAVEDSEGSPGAYTQAVSGAGALHLSVGPDAWPEAGAEVYIVPRTGDMPASPMAQVTYELTGTVVTVEIADAA